MKPCSGTGVSWADGSDGSRDLPAFLHRSEEQLLGSVCLWEQGEPGLSHHSEDLKLSLSHLEKHRRSWHNSAKTQKCPWYWSLQGVVAFTDHGFAPVQLLGSSQQAEQQEGCLISSMCLRLDWCSRKVCASAPSTSRRR